MNTTHYTEAEIKAIKNALLAYKIAVGCSNNNAESKDKYQDICLALFKVASEIKSAKNALKYDPCRKFRKGDIVKVKEHIDGRKLHAFTTGLTLGKTYTVEQDEIDCKIQIKNDDGYGIYAFVHFELITPVEELEPYKVIHDKDLEFFEVCHYEMGDDTIAEEGKLHKIVMTTYWYGNSQWDRSEEEAKAAAEDERDHLNAEYRKEQK